MTRAHFKYFPALLVIALAGAGCDVSVGEHGFSLDLARGKAQDEWTRTYTLGPGGQLEIVNINGTITASPSPDGQVEVRAERIAKASSDEAAQDLLKQIEIAETASGDRVRLETKVPRQSFGRSGHEVRYVVKVPKGLSVSFETVNGGVRLENLDGRVAASTTNGGVRGSGLSGAVKASTTNGGVEISMAGVTGDLELETTNGGIRLQLPGDTRATLEARCTNGGISVAGDLPVDASEKSRRLFRGTLNGGGPKISAETVNGGIRISAAGASADPS
jgi:hypothetical protein